MIAAAGALAVATLSIPVRSHMDDSDAALYAVVARNIVRSGEWMSLSYLPGVHAHFYEHLPFGLWPQAAAIQLFGEPALKPFNALLCVAILGVLAGAGAALVGWEAATVATVVLSLNDTFFLYGARPRLDPLLMLAVAVTCLALTRARRKKGTGYFSAWMEALAVAGAAVGALVKGPFGLAVLGCWLLAEWLLDRSWGRAVRSAVMFLLACLPLAAFLGWDLGWNGGAWWTGYVKDQLLASALGGRDDGVLAWWYPLASIAGRFWPGLPLVVVGAIFGWRTERFRPLILATGLLVLSLTLPHRKVWNHTLVAYPLLELVAAIGIAEVGARLLRNARAKRIALNGFVGAAVVACVASATVGVRALAAPPCVFAQELSEDLRALRPAATIAVVSEQPAWRTVSELAFEFDAHPVPVQRAEEVRGADAVVTEPGAPKLTDPGWCEKRFARGWTLYVRCQ